MKMEPTKRGDKKVFKVNDDLKYAVVCLETGESYLLSEGQIVVSDSRKCNTETPRADSEKYKPNPQDDFYFKSGHGMLFNSAMEHFNNLDLGVMDYRVLMLLFSRTWATTGLLRHNNGFPVTKEWICKTLDKSEKRVRLALNNLEYYRIIAKERIEKETKYYMNPYVFSKSKKIDEHLHKLFKDSVWFEMRKRDNP